jgi:hypothetical protein
MEEITLSRIINPENAGKERKLLLRGIALAMRDLSMDKGLNTESYDKSAFIIMALGKIEKTVETSVEAWERRGYWIKADKFRIEWSWAGKLAGKLRTAIMDGDWEKTTFLAASIQEKLHNISIPARFSLGTPWKGAWEEYQKIK